MRRETEMVDGAWSRRALRCCAVLVLVGTAGIVANLFAPAHFASGRAGQLVLLLEGPLLAAVGGFLIRRRADHPAGYLLAVAAAGLVLDAPAKAVLNLGVDRGALARLAVTVDNTGWVLTYWAIAMLVILFPDGRLISARWRPLPVVATLVCVLLLIGGLAAPYDISYGTARHAYPGVPALFGANGFDRVYRESLGDGFPLYVLVIAVALGSLVVRARRARRDGTVAVVAQLRWLTWSIALVFVIDAFAGSVRQVWSGAVARTVVGVITQAAPCLLVLALFVAVSRHGLFEIDRIVSRTVSYLVLSGLLAASYLGLVAGASALLPARQDSLVVAGATLVVAALFVPLRRAVQRRVDRRFNRTRFDRAVLVERFVERLRQDLPAGGESTELLAVVHRALQPGLATIWLATTPPSPR